MLFRSRHHISRALSCTVLSRTLPCDQCLCWSTWVMRVPRHHRLHAHICMRHSCSQSLAVARQYSSHIRSPMFTRTQNCLTFHTSILAFACWFTHIDSRTAGMSSHSTRNVTLPLSQEFFSQCFAVPFSVYGRCHCSCQAQHESASPVQPQLAQLKEGRLD